ncbi:hypothetical protein M9458_037776, partial [Cirrhinus mrigala]
IHCPFFGIKSLLCSFFPPGNWLDTLPSEEVDVESVKEDSLPQLPQYEELLEVVTCAVAKLNINRPAEKQAEP